MKKFGLLFALFCSFTTFAQNTPEENVWFAKDFQVGLGLSNLMPNESMMGDAHKMAKPVIYARLGIFHYKQFTLGLHGNASTMNVKNTQYYGDFNRTNFYTLGPYLSYFQPVSSTIILEPYLSYDGTEYRSKYNDKKLSYSSDALGIGLDFEYKIDTNAYFIFGLKYSISKLNTNTNPNWEKYLNNYNFLSAKIGFAFAKHRL